MNWKFCMTGNEHWICGAVPLDLEEHVGKWVQGGEHISLEKESSAAVATPHFSSRGQQAPSRIDMHGTDVEVFCEVFSLVPLFFSKEFTNWFLDRVKNFPKKVGHYCREQIGENCRPERSEVGQRVSSGDCWLYDFVVNNRLSILFLFSFFCLV